MDSSPEIITHKVFSSAQASVGAHAPKKGRPSYEMMRAILHHNANEMSTSSELVRDNNTQDLSYEKRAKDWAHMTIEGVKEFLQDNGIEIRKDSLNPSTVIITDALQQMYSLSAVKVSRASKTPRIGVRFIRTDSHIRKCDGQQRLDYFAPFTPEESTRYVREEEVRVLSRLSRDVCRQFVKTAESQVGGGGLLLYSGAPKKLHDLLALLVKDTTPFIRGDVTSTPLMQDIVVSGEVATALHTLIHGLNQVAENIGLGNIDRRLRFVADNRPVLDNEVKPKRDSITELLAVLLYVSESLGRNVPNLVDQAGELWMTLKAVRHAVTEPTLPQVQAGAPATLATENAHRPHGTNGHSVPLNGNGSMVSGLTLEA